MMPYEPKKLESIQENSSCHTPCCQTNVSKNCCSDLETNYKLSKELLKQTLYLCLANGISFDELSSRAEGILVDSPKGLKKVNEKMKRYQKRMKKEEPVAVKSEKTNDELVNAFMKSAILLANDYMVRKEKKKSKE